jgi:hypothetical protein
MMWPDFIKLITPIDAVGFWTMLMTIVTIALACIAWRGLRSLNLTKTDMLTRSKREARQCAISRCEELAKVIIPANQRLSSKLGAAQIPVFVKSPEEVTFDPKKSDHLPKAREWVSKLPTSLHNDCIHHINMLEGWAMYFTNLIADEQIAFGPCAPVFCSQMAQYFPVFVVHRANQRSGKYPNAVKLFEIWRHRLETAESGIKMQELVEKISELQKRPSGPQPLPLPLGTDIT